MTARQKFRAAMALVWRNSGKGRFTWEERK